MTPERWTRLKDVLSLALKHPAHQRAAVVDSACGGEEALRREVEELLACEPEMGEFLAAPLLGEIPEEAESDAVPDALRSWTRYEVLERLGSGGMAVVYKARDARLHRLVAVKVISSGDDVTVRRFLREAESQARVDHDHVVKVYETGDVGRHHYIAMQYVDGPTLLDVRDETTIDGKVDLMRQVAEGLHEAHRQGLVHRDIKPGNILVERGPTGLKPYLLDFGLAAEIGAPGLTQTGVVVGTPRYMAPERIQGGATAVDRRTDIYSLGATCYEFFCGSPPFAETSGLRVLSEILDGELVPPRCLDPSLPTDVDAIVCKCLERDPQHRYASARALADDFRAYLDGRAVTARPMGPLRQMARTTRRHPRVAVAFLAMLTTIAAVAGWGAYGYWRSARQADLAQQLGQEVRNIEWLFRAAQMAPVHPIDQEKREVRRRMARVEQMMADVGSLAAGPGNYALGRGFLTLGDAAQALARLEQAWSAGYRTADASMALGLAHGDIFRTELAKAQRIPAERERVARIRELSAAHEQRALAYLEQGRSSTIVPARYVDALVASHRGDRRTAIEKAGQAAGEVPWLFEARLLAGHLEFKEAVALYLAGKTPQGAARANEADQYYADAQRIAASSIDASLGRCAVSGLLLHMVMHQLPIDPAPAHREGEASCGRALALEPDNAEAHRLYSDVVRTWAGTNVLAGRDPGDAYDRAAALVERANALLGDNVEILLVLGDTFLDRAWWESRTDRDPRDAVARAIATYEKVRVLDPRNVTAVNNMGQALLLRSRFEATQALDPIPSLDGAIAVFQRAVTIDPAQASPYRNLAKTAIARADEQERRGVTPTPDLTEIIQFIERQPGDPSDRDRVEALARLRERKAR